MIEEQFNEAVDKAHSILEIENIVICKIYFRSAMNAFAFYSYIDANDYGEYLTLSDKIVVALINSYDVRYASNAAHILGYILSNITHIEVSSIEIV